MDAKVILETALYREEISAIEALMLLQDERVCRSELLKVANILNERINNTTVTYVRSKQVHYTNVCRADCKFCSFYRKKKKKGTFSLKAQDVLRALRENGPVRQLVLTGGLNAELSLSFHLQMLRQLRQEHPNLHIHAYSPVEVHFIARRARTTPFDVLRKLQSAGLGSLSGDSAEILNDKIRKKICPDKIRTADWVDIVKTAHRLGIPTTATMLFGHIEDEIQICEHLEIIKNIQRETGGFVAFEPIPFVPANTTLGKERKIRAMTPLSNILRMYAIARVFFGRLIPNIQVDWTKVGLPTAVKCLQAGANDLGGLSVDQHEIRPREVNGRVSLAPHSVKQAVQRAGRKAIERPPYSARMLQQRRAMKEEPVLV